MSAPGCPARRPRRRWENRAGWWGILRVGAAVTTTAVLLAAVLAQVLGGGHAGASALLGGGVVVALSALTGLTTAVAWDRAREAAMPLSIGVFALKLAAFGLLLTVVPLVMGLLEPLG